MLDVGVKYHNIIKTRDRHLYNITYLSSSVVVNLVVSVFVKERPPRLAPDSVIKIKMK